MPWETKVEVQVGDMVWFDYYHGKYCSFIQVEDKMYRMINYRYLIVAKRIKSIEEISKDKYFHGLTMKIDERGIEINKNEFESQWTIPLNGFCLFEQVFESPNTQLIVNKHLNKKQGKVKYIGNRNKSYLKHKNKPERYDDIEIKVGDIVIFRNETECLLENENHYKFDNVPLRYNQRADILGIIN
jgi:hypothetical protein